MVERRQVKEEGARAESGDTEAEQDRVLEAMPNGMTPPKTIQDGLAAELLEIAERQVADTRKKLGPQASKPRLKRIDALFNRYAGSPPRAGTEITNSMTAAGTIPQLTKYDMAFDQTLAAAFYNFDRSSAQAGADIQNAHDAWTLEVRLYRSDERSAGAILSAAIQTASLHDDQNYDEPMRTKSHVDYYRKSTKIAEAILVYEETMRQGGMKLATAFGRLMQNLYEAANDLAVAEAALIATTQLAYNNFWTNVQSVIGQQARL